MRLKRLLAGTLAVAATAILAGGTLAQSGDPSSKRVAEPPQTNGEAVSKRAAEPPQTTGQAPRQSQAPVGHRQPTAKDVPPEDSATEPSPEHREIDRKLNICRGC